MPQRQIAIPNKFPPALIGAHMNSIAKLIEQEIAEYLIECDPQKPIYPDLSVNKDTLTYKGFYFWSPQARRWLYCSGNQKLQDHGFGECCCPSRIWAENGKFVKSCKHSYDSNSRYYFDGQFDELPDDVNVFYFGKNPRNRDYYTTNPDSEFLRQFGENTYLQTIHTNTNK